MNVQFYKHNLTAKDKAACKKVLDSLFLTTGAVVKEFETKLASYTKNKYAVGLTSCTSALYLSLKYFNIQKGDEVITTPLSFIATANVIEQCGATPIFVDVEQATGNINADLIEKAITKKTKAILVVHLYGQMCDMKKIRKIANKYKLKVIEDAAHCVEGERDNVKVGELGDIACYSFYATKNLTSGEGGAITTNDKNIYEWFIKARLHGMSKSAADRYTKKYEHYDMEFLGYKANMSNIQASLLVNQIDNIEKYLKKREALAQKYNKGFYQNSTIHMPAVLSDSKHARHLYTIWVGQDKRDHYLHKIQSAGIGVAVNFRAIHLMSYYRKKYNYKENSFPIAERIANATITLPFYPRLTNKEVQYVVHTVSKLLL